MEINAGHDFIIKTYSLDTNAQSITFTRPFRNAFMQCRDLTSDIIIRRVGTDSDFFTLKAGSGLELTCQRVLASGGASITLCDARVGTGTATLEVIFVL